MESESRAVAGPPLLALLQRGARWFTEELTARLAAAGVGPITPAHAAVLAQLGDDGPVSIAELARRADVTRQTMHRAVTQLVEEGLLTSAPGPGFPRTTLIGPTEVGRRRREVAAGILRDLEREIEGRLHPGGLEDLRDTLARAWGS